VVTTVRVAPTFLARRNWRNSAGVVPRDPSPHATALACSRAPCTSPAGYSAVRIPKVDQTTSMKKGI